MVKWGTRLEKILPLKSPRPAEPLEFIHLPPLPFEKKDPALERPKRVAFEDLSSKPTTPTKTALNYDFPEHEHKRQKRHHPILSTPHPLPTSLSQEENVARHDLHGRHRRHRDQNRHHLCATHHSPAMPDDGDTPRYVVSSRASSRELIWNWNVLNHPNMAVAFRKGTQTWRVWSDLRSLVVHPPILYMKLKLHPTHRSAKVFGRWPSIRVHAADATRGITLFDMFTAVHEYFEQPCSMAEINRLAALDRSYMERQLSQARYRLRRTNQDLPPDRYFAEMAVGLRRKHFLYHGKTMFEKIEYAAGIRAFYLFLGE